MRTPCGNAASCRLEILSSITDHGRNDAHLVVGGDRRLQVFEVANVFIIYIDIHEPAKLVAVEQSLANGGVLGAKLAQDLADRRTGRFDTSEAPRMGAQWGGDTHDWHGYIPCLLFVVSCWWRVPLNRHSESSMGFAGAAAMNNVSTATKLSTGHGQLTTG